MQTILIQPTMKFLQLRSGLLPVPYFSVLNLLAHVRDGEMAISPANMGSVLLIQRHRQGHLLRVLVISRLNLTYRLGHVWSQLCDGLPHHVSQGRAREAILNLPDVDSASIPDDALWAAVVCLGILAHTYRYEEKYNGHEGGILL